MWPAQLILNAALTWCLVSQRIFFGFWSMDCCTVRTENGWFCSIFKMKHALSEGQSLNSASQTYMTGPLCVPHLWRQNTSISHYWLRWSVEEISFWYKFKTQPVLYLCWRLEGKIPFNVVYASFKWPWAPGTGTWCPVCAEVSWWVYTTLFPRKIDGFSPPPKYES